MDPPVKAAWVAELGEGRYIRCDGKSLSSYVCDLIPPEGAHGNLWEEVK